MTFAIYCLAPWGCDASAWLCPFPLSSLGAAPVVALCLPILFYVNQRRRHPFPDGWFTVARHRVQPLGTRRLYEADFFFEALIFPQGLACGAFTGAIFYASLALEPDLKRVE